ncbi:MAG: hypothetical protein ABJN42_20945 [Roseibium sp.]|uniref:hypothetical protein n=1 Tax=Roseibium sp. TaxID=1936156 RepID=UPI00329774E2
MMENHGIPPFLYHATGLKAFNAILEEGLRTEHFGAVHGAMEYAPAGPSIYLSRHESSSNLNTALFDEGTDRVRLLKIDTSYLDVDLIYPDDALMYLVDEDYLEDCETFKDLTRPIISDFAERFGMNLNKARRVLTSCLEDGEKGYPAALREMWPEYLKVEGEVAYLGDIDPEAVCGWKAYCDRQWQEHPDPSDTLEP